MEREILEGLGLDETQIESVLEANRKSVEQYTEQIDEIKLSEEGVQKELNVLEDVVKTLNSKVDDESSGKLGKSEAEVKLLRDEIESLKLDSDKKVNQLKFDSELDLQLVKSGTKSTKAIKALIDKDGLKYEGGKILGLDEEIERLVGEYDYLFESKGDHNYSRISKSKSTGSMSKEEFNGMDYKSKLKFKSERPEEYKKLRRL